MFMKTLMLIKISVSDILCFHVLVSARHSVYDSILRSPNGRKEDLVRDRVLLNPIKDCVKVAANVGVVKIWERHFLYIDPIVEYGLNTSTAHQVLQQNLQYLSVFCRGFASSASHSPRDNASRALCVTASEYRSGICLHNNEGSS